MADERPGVLHVIPDLNVGGAQRFLLDLVTQQRSQGSYRPILTVLGRNDAGMAAQGTALEAQFLNRSPGNYPIEPSLVSRLIRIGKEHRVGLVHSHLWPASLAGALAARMLGVLMWCTSRTPVRFSGRSAYVTACDDGWTGRRWQSDAPAIVAVSRSVEDYAASPMAIPEIGSK